MPTALPVASPLDTGLALQDVFLPLVAQGAILRRPRLGTLAEQLHADDRALRRVRHLRRKYGEGPVLFRFPGRTIALVLAPDDVCRLLAETPEPFTAATTDKAGALRHFQPHSVLVSDPPLRAPRRELNEQVLDTHQPVHRHGHRMLEVVREELDTMTATLSWDDFRAIWSRIARRIVLGDSARDDTEVSAQLDQLRADANWAGFHRRRDELRHHFLAALGSYVDEAEQGSLVEIVHDLGADHGGVDSADANLRLGDLDPAGQVPHWLFAFDAAGIALWRLFAVLATRPAALEQIVAEGNHPEASPLLAEAGAAVQESLRLWPTTLVVLRESDADTEWRGRIAPAGTEFAIVSSVFHRDEQALDFAHRFEPMIWLDGRSDASWPIIPFSAGPAECPGRNVVLLTTSAAVSHVSMRYNLDLDPTTRAKLAGRMPTTLNHATIRLGFWRQNCTAEGDSP
ncbi:cytochrome P450 [Kribbella capetownensis]|uniref:Cytochrome P450 n=1 Tax=Kribbella capetownensis TaxID=1572659 RepID=A0A4R0JJ64_9ACTN|nr:cytochrome P450 [Kribbella capetownensis]TCC45764.1 cytochrome P450 [Kribbella capetownensis]